MDGLTLIAAMDLRRAIGARNTIPWSLPEDMRHFREVTTGHVVIMGRLTWESLGRPLPARTNVVISRNAGLSLPPGVFGAPSLTDALSLAKDVRPAARRFVIGGGEVYRQALPFASHLDLTQIQMVVPDADTWFPEYENGQAWDLEVGPLKLSRKGLAYRFVTGTRRNPLST